MNLYYPRLFEHWIQEGSIDKLRVLVGCEFSDSVASQFRALGHFAYSCDLLPSEGEHGNRYHLQGDIGDALESGFPWDIIILHPPCTALAVSGNAHYGFGMAKYSERVQAKHWAHALWRLAVRQCNHVALENPVGVLNTQSNYMPKPSYIQPYQFGHTESKKTGLWLHNLPKLLDTDNVYDAMMLLPKKERMRIHYMSPSAERGKLRSMTYPGIAQAMAVQWSDHVMKLRSE